MRENSWVHWVKWLNCVDDDKLFTRQAILLRTRWSVGTVLMSGPSWVKAISELKLREKNLLDGNFWVIFHESFLESQNPPRTPRHQKPLFNRLMGPMLWKMTNLETPICQPTDLLSIHTYFILSKKKNIVLEDRESAKKNSMQNQIPKRNKITRQLFMWLYISWPWWWMTDALLENTAGKAKGKKEPSLSPWKTRERIASSFSSSIYLTKLYMCVLSLWRVCNSF